MDKLLSFVIVTEMLNIKKFMDRNILRDKSWQELLVTLSTDLDEAENDGLVSQPSKVYFPVLDKASKSWILLNDALMRVGQMQIVRSCIAHELNTSCKFQSRHLASTLHTLNE